MNSIEFSIMFNEAVAEPRQRSGVNGYSKLSPMASQNEVLVEGTFHGCSSRIIDFNIQ